MMAAQQDRRWIQDELTRDSWPWSVYNRNMTVLGLGTIGEEVARRAHAFGMRVTGIRRRFDLPAPSFVDRVLGPDQLHEALHGCDVLVISAPFLAGTDRLIGAREIAMMNRDAILINVARGRIVEESALLDGLQTGQLGGAV